MTDPCTEETTPVATSPVKETIAAPTKSPKSSPTKKDIDVATEALNQFAQGKRHLLVNDITLAVNSLQEACRLLAEHYGETAPECADAYFYYGKSLLELARIENGVLGNALDGVPEEDAEADSSQIEDPEKLSAEEKDVVSEVVGEALEENFIENEKRQKKENGKDCTDGGGVSKCIKATEEVEMCSKDVKSDETSKNTKETEKETKESVKEEEDSEKEAKIVKDETKSKNDEETKSKEEVKSKDIKETDEKMETDSPKGSPKKSETDEKMEIDSPKKSEDKATESPKQSENGASKASENGSKAEEKDSEEEKNDKDEEEVEDEEEEEGEETAENGEEKSQGETEESEDVGNLQLAWEMLELAKVIYTKQLEEKPKMNLKIAQVHLKLGEVGLEGENYQQSVEDLKKCFEIQAKELASDDRCLAETHYQLGVAYSFSEDFDNAIESFKNAAKVVEERKEKLHKLKTEKESWTKEQKLKDSEGKDLFYTEASEIEELSNLLPEIKDKIIDMEDMKKDSTEKLKKIKEATFATLLGGSRSGEASTSGQSSTGFDAPSAAFDAPSSSSAFDTASTTTEKATSNITHLVRKKRKPDEEAEPAEVSKKAKGENGEAVAAPVDEENKPENGVEKKEKDKAPMETEETNEASKITEIKKAVAETTADEKKSEDVSA